MPRLRNHLRRWPELNRQDAVDTLIVLALSFWDCVSPPTPHRLKSKIISFPSKQLPPPIPPLRNPFRNLAKPGGDKKAKSQPQAHKSEGHNKRVLLIDGVEFGYHLRSSQILWSCFTARSPIRAQPSCKRMNRNVPTATRKAKVRIFMLPPPLSAPSESRSNRARRGTLSHGQIFREFP